MGFEEFLREITALQRGEKRPGNSYGQKISDSEIFGLFVLRPHFSLKMATLEQALFMLWNLRDKIMRIASKTKSNSKILIPDFVGADTPKPL